VLIRLQLCYNHGETFAETLHTLRLRWAQAQPNPEKASSEHRSVYVTLTDSSRYHEEPTLAAAQVRDTMPKTSPTPHDESRSAIVHYTKGLTCQTVFPHPRRSRSSRGTTSTLAQHHTFGSPRNTEPSSAGQCPSRHVHLGEENRLGIWSCVACKYGISLSRSCAYVTECSACGSYVRPNLCNKRTVSQIPHTHGHVQC
jgi:hypothetical protein